MPVYTTVASSPSTAPATASTLSTAASTALSTLSDLATSAVLGTTGDVDPTALDALIHALYRFLLSLSCTASGTEGVPQTYDDF
ncbi:hypothetical protein GNI_133570 [Gregarina niphandrodes]|uniref:Uncharacterized protein n=1 Tax=Gregarina niphandrodes TaxID=110365 RepID=A0A023B196_GRENI|nr:hypothetical protein GNI_133570 [Gregarina niphandrodes]EZG46516.1 hypothetical protein GNI_133570 [Gregarina niphandrodes]|eukprot:XP_011132289.1 hypothetical protein GNI_133570 [Gregarina niphandrodes]